MQWSQIRKIALLSGIVYSKAMPVRYVASVFYFMMFIAVFACVTAKGDTLPISMHMRGLAIQAETTTLHIQSGVLFSQTKVLQSILEEGIVVRFTYGLQVEQQRTLWLNKSLARETRTILLAFDPLSKDFTAKEQSENITAHKSLDVLLKTLTRNITFSLPLESPLIPKKKYLVMTSVTLQKNDMPKWVQTSLFFWSWDIVPPIRLSQNFIF